MDSSQRYPPHSHPRVTPGRFRACERTVSLVPWPRRLSKLTAEVRHWTRRDGCTRCQHRVLLRDVVNVTQSDRLLAVPPSQLLLCIRWGEPEWPPDVSCQRKFHFRLLPPVVERADTNVSGSVACSVHRTPQGATCCADMGGSGGRREREQRPSIHLAAPRRCLAGYPGLFRPAPHQWP